MENFIKYYYKLNIQQIYVDGEKYFFNDNNYKYMLKQYNNSNFFLYYDILYNQLQKYKYFFEVLLNINNEYITWINNKPYILMRLSNINMDLITIFDIKTDLFIDYNAKLYPLVRFPWNNLWENKIDYFENLINSKQNKFRKIYPLFHYFIGIAENALLYFKINEQEEKKEPIDQKMVISHDRILPNYSLYDYYDPTNIIIDHYSRDISEYIKYSFLNHTFDINIISDYLSQHNFSKYGIRTMYARILFPSFFFDLIEKMLTLNQEIDLLHLETMIGEFELFIKEISNLFQKLYDIPVISWI